MGAAISKGAKGIGTLLGNAFVAPIKSVFGGSCDFASFLSHVPGGNLPMHCEKPLQDVLGCVSDILMIGNVTCVIWDNPFHFVAESVFLLEKLAIVKVAPSDSLLPLMRHKGILNDGVKRRSFGELIKGLTGVLGKKKQAPTRLLAFSVWRHINYLDLGLAMEIVIEFQFTDTYESNVPWA
ncbi:hypothetical protein RHGRI_025284 [Rhododendron griersonianum]|uniref:Uncharacterized protein n=1 Tax=Rhododendron griersonianum TaxID=479676 RepID=A0AAV6JE04_9ERIC|nr:hypothetical protein RHGRI_025284 [Rhododendron griersonianum]